MNKDKKLKRTEYGIKEPVKLMGIKLFSILCLLISTYIANSSETNELLSVDNLTLMVLKNSSLATQQKYLLAAVKNDPSSNYYKIRKNKEQLQKLLNDRQEQLTAKTAKISHDTLFILEQKVTIESFDQEKGLLTIKNAFKGTSKYFKMPNYRDDGLPNHINVLIANTDLQKNIPIATETYTDLVEKNSFSFTEKTPLHATFTFKLPKYQNGNNFQAVITAIDLFTSKKKIHKLTSHKESRDFNQLINDWFLADGFTSKLIGNHSFSFFGYRVQDKILNANTLIEQCKKTIRIGPHQVLVCNNHISENSQLIITYIGGRVAQIDLVATAELTQNEKKLLSTQIMTQLNQERSIFEQDHLHWNKYNVDFDFYSDAFFNQTNKASTYYFKYNSSKPTKSAFTTIVSIISQATKRQIEENT